MTDLQIILCYFAGFIITFIAFLFVLKRHREYNDDDIYIVIFSAFIWPLTWVGCVLLSIVLLMRAIVKKFLDG